MRTPPLDRRPPLASGALATLLLATACGPTDLGASGAEPEWLGHTTANRRSIKVAAIQYGPESYMSVAGCSNNRCGLMHFIRQAAANGADYVVTPEYVLGGAAELEPVVGDRPAKDGRWAKSSNISTMAALADGLNITLVFQLTTYRGSALHNSQIVVSPAGAVLATHHKYYLYAGEKASLDAGSNCCDSFTTPAGKASLLICADINCIVYLDASKSSCTAAGLKQLQAFRASRPRIVFFSSYWMAWRSPQWRATAVMAKLARYTGAYVVGANTIADKYHGGGVFAPDGTVLELADATTPGIAYGVIPPPDSATPDPPASSEMFEPSAPAAPSATSRVVISEIMANPSAVTDANGEWFELHNAGTTAVDLAGWSVRDATGKGFTIHAAAGLRIQAGRRIVLGRHGELSSNGGVPVDYSYGSWSLVNTGDRIELRDADDHLVDRVTYTGAWDLPAGASLSLKSADLDNALQSSWCQEPYAWDGSAGDAGSPGQAPRCH